MDIETITYQQVIDGYVSEGDVYGLAAYALAEPRKTAFLSNPFLTDTSKVMLKLLRDNGIIIGRSMMFPSRFKADDKVIETMGGSALEVAREYRNTEAGGVLMAYNIRHKENNALISSGFSREAAKCHSALRAYMLCFPQFMQVRDFRKMLPKTGINEVWSNILGALCNILTRPILFCVKIVCNRISKKYDIEQLTAIPEWVDDIVLNDGHKYMEVHNHKWLQWMLDNMFHCHENNKSRFYVVKQGVENLGFFMITERARSIKNGNNKEYLAGTICEWGTVDSARLSEYDIHAIALNKFSKKTDVVFMATNNSYVKRRMKRLFFLRKGESQIAFYDLKKEYKDAKDINLWRVRMGYGDTILN